MIPEAITKTTRDLSEQYLKPLLEKHNRNQPLYYEDLVGSWMNVNVEPLLQKEGQITETETALLYSLHVSLLAAYEQSAREYYQSILYEALASSSSNNNSDNDEDSGDNCDQNHHQNYFAVLPTDFNSENIDEYIERCKNQVMSLPLLAWANNSKTQAVATIKDAQENQFRSPQQKQQQHYVWRVPNDIVEESFWIPFRQEAAKRYKEGLQNRLEHLMLQKRKQQEEYYDDDDDDEQTPSTWTVTIPTTTSLLLHTMQQQQEEDDDDQHNQYSESPSSLQNTLVMLTSSSDSSYIQSTTAIPLLVKDHVFTQENKDNRNINHIQEQTTHEKEDNITTQHEDIIMEDFNHELEVYDNYDDEEDGDDEQKEEEQREEKVEKSENNNNTIDSLEQDNDHHLHRHDLIIMEEDEMIHHHHHDNEDKKTQQDELQEDTNHEQQLVIHQSDPRTTMMKNIVQPEQALSSTEVEAPPPLTAAQKRLLRFSTAHNKKNEVNSLSLSTSLQSTRSNVTESTTYTTTVSNTTVASQGGMTTGQHKSRSGTDRSNHSYSNRGSKRKIMVGEKVYVPNKIANVSISSTSIQQQQQPSSRGRGGRRRK